MKPLPQLNLQLAKLKKIADPPGFEPGPEAPEASILSWLYYESTRLALAARCDRN
jgi:hypothetical protein